MKYNDKLLGVAGAVLYLTVFIGSLFIAGCDIDDKPYETDFKYDDAVKISCPNDFYYNQRGTVRRKQYYFISNAKNEPAYLVKLRDGTDVLITENCLVKVDSIYDY